MIMILMRSLQIVVIEYLVGRAVMCLRLFWVRKIEFIVCLNMWIYVGENVMAEVDLTLDEISSTLNKIKNSFEEWDNVLDKIKGSSPGLVVSCMKSIPRNHGCFVGKGIGLAHEQIRVEIGLYMVEPLVSIVLEYGDFYYYLIGLNNKICDFDQDYRDKQMILEGSIVSIDVCFLYRDQIGELYDLIMKYGQCTSGPVMLHDHKFIKQYAKTTKALEEYVGNTDDMKNVAYLRKHSDGNTIKKFVSDARNNIEERAINIVKGLIDGGNDAVEMMKVIKWAHHREECVEYACCRGSVQSAINLIDDVLVKGKRDIEVFCGETIKWERYLSGAIMRN